MGRGSIELRDGIHWVGARDPEMRLFDLIMHTEHGTSYNAYLVRGSKHTALIEMVKQGFEASLLDNIREVMEPREIDFIVCNHTEPDHTGALAALLEAAPRATLVATGRGAHFLGEQQNRELAITKVKAGDSLDLGGRTLSFVPAPFLHWPDSMFTYLEEDHILFSGDVFGAHFCPPPGVITDDAPGIATEALHKATRHYYLTIMAPFAGHLQKGLAKLDGLTLAMLCPSHGPVRRADVQGLVELHRDWATPRSAPLAVVFYASIYGHTKQLAEAVARGLEERGVPTTLLDLESADPWAVLHTSWEADIIAVGSPTLNGGPAPHAAAVLAGLDPHRAKGKRFLAFGSYGWSGEAVSLLTERAAALKMTTIDSPPLRVIFAPTKEDLAQATEAGHRLSDPS